MARMAVPVVKLQYAAADAYDNRVVEVFQHAGVWASADGYTFTGRVSVSDASDPHTVSRRAAVAAELRDVLPTDQADCLLKFLEAHDWDVSFFVDCW